MNIDLKELQAIHRESNWLDVVSQSPTHLLIDVDSAEPPSFDLGPVLEWLAYQPLPVIVVGDTTSDWAWGADCCFDAHADAQASIDGINAHPIAAATLVQVTRITPQLSLRDALVVESLAYSTLLAGSEFGAWLATRPKPSERTLTEPVTLHRDTTHLHIALNAPQIRNALTMDLRDALTEAFELVLMDTTIESAKVYGNGPCFSAGGDLNEFGLAADLAMAHQVRQIRMPGQYIGLAPERFEFWVHGACIGGGIELPAFAGTIAAEEGCQFRIPEVGFGLIPGAGGCVSIPRRIGRHEANAWALSQRTIDSSEALALGLIDGITPRPGWAAECER